MVDCPKFGDDRQRRPFTQAERDVIARRAATYDEILRAANRTDRAVGQAAAEQFEINNLRRIWVQSLGAMRNLRSTDVRRIQDLLVHQLGVMNRNLGLNPSLQFSKVGEVRYHFVQARQVIEGMIHTAGRLISAGNVIKFETYFDSLLKKYHIDKRTGQRLFSDVLEIGAIPSEMSNVADYRSRQLGMGELASNALGVNNLSEAFQRRRYNRLIDQLNGLGFSRQDIDGLLNRSTLIHESFENVRLVARAAGVDVSRLSNLGYFVRIITRDFTDRLNDLKSAEIIEQVYDGTTAFSTIHNRSRSTQWLVPEDIAITSAVIGRKPEEITDMVLNRPREWMAYLNSNLSSEQIDLLVDSGVMQKYPMASTEIFDYFVEQYDLPYDQMRHMFRQDPVFAMERYVQSLQRSAGNSAMIQRVVSGDAFRSGWAATGQMIRENADLANFVPLSTSMDEWAKQARIPVPHEALGINEATYREFNDIYVHPIVADTMRSYLDISTDPAKLQLAARTLIATQRFVSKQVLTNLRFVYNTFMQGIVATHAAGSSMLMHLPAMNHIHRTMMQGLDWTDEVRGTWTVGNQTFTFRQLMEYFFIHLGHNVAPGTNMLRVNSHAARTNLATAIMEAPENLGRAFFNMMSYTMASGDPVSGRHIPLYERPFRMGRKVAQGVEFLADEAYSLYGYAANLSDLVFKWSAFLSFTEQSSGSRFWNVASTLATGQVRQFDSFDDIVRHVDQYFVNPYHQGQFTRTINDWVAPFASWAMMNPFMQIRHMMRNPHQVVNAMRIYSFWNSPMYADEDYNEDTVPDWVRYGGPLYMGRDLDGRTIVMMPQSWDSLQDFVSWSVEGSANVNREIFGQRQGSPEQLRVFDRSRRESFENFLLDASSRLHVVWRTGIETAIGRDWTGSSFIPEDETDIQPTLWGMRVPPRLINALRKFPLIDAIDRMNPGGVFGTAPVMDTRGVIIQGESPAWTGAARQRISSRTLDRLGDNPAYTLMRFMGANMRTLDYDRGIQTTISDLELTMTILEESISDARITLTTRDLSEQEYDRIYEEMENKIILLFQYRFHHMRATQWAQENGVLPRNALRELNNLRLRLSDTPMPGDELIEQLTIETLQQFELPENPE